MPPVPFGVKLLFGSFAYNNRKHGIELVLASDFPCASTDLMSSVVASPNVGGFREKNAARFEQSSDLSEIQVLATTRAARTIVAVEADSVTPTGQCEAVQITGTV